MRGRGGLCCRAGSGRRLWCELRGLPTALCTEYPMACEAFYVLFGKRLGFSFPGASIGPGRRVVGGGLGFCLGVRVRGGMEFVVVYVCIVWMDGWMDGWKMMARGVGWISWDFL